MQAWEKTRTLCVIVVVGLTVAVAYHAFLGHVLGVPFPGNTIFYDPALRFSDFYWIFNPVKAGSPLSGNWSVYPPFAYVPLIPLAGFSWPVAYAIMVAVFLGSMVWFFWEQLTFLDVQRRIAAATILPLLSYGTLFAIDRGNVDQLVVTLVLLFFSLFARGRYNWSAVPLAAAIAMKIYPGALGVLLLYRRQYKAAALTGALTIAFTVLCSAAYPGGLLGTYALLQARMADFQRLYVANGLSHQDSVSYLSLIKIIMRTAHLDFNGHAAMILHVYSLGCAVIFVITIAYIMLRERALWKQVYLLIFIMLVLPQVSFNYKLTLLLLPLVLYLKEPGSSRREDLFFMWSFGILMIPKSYFPVHSYTKVSAFLNPAALTLMAAYIIWTGLRRTVMDVDVAMPHAARSVAS